MRLGGRHLTEYYTKHLTAENDFPFEKNNKMSVIEKLKETSTLVTKDYERSVAAWVLLYTQAYMHMHIQYAYTDSHMQQTYCTNNCP